MRAGRWPVIGGAVLLVVGVTTWLLLNGTRGAEVANVLALPVAVAGLIATVAGLWLVKRPEPAKSEIPPDEDQSQSGKPVPVVETRCGFCGNKRSKVKRLITNGRFYICDECIGLSTEIIDEEFELDRAKAVARVCELTLQLANPDLEPGARHELLQKLDDEAGNTRPTRRPRAGDAVAGVKLVRIVGTGNFGTVWQASGPGMTSLAVKIFDPDKISIGLMLWRFQRGIRAMKHLTDLGATLPPSICRIQEVSRDLLSFSMPYLPGGDLSRLRSLGWSSEKKFSIFYQVAKAVEFAHDNGIVHRDIKPANIVIDTGGNAVLTDFDIADLTFAATQSMYAASLGSPHFAAPEQLSGEMLNAEPTTDIFSLGKLLYFLITEKSPPFGTSDAQSLADIEDEQIRQVISTCLRLDPAQRYQSVSDLLQALQPTVQRG